VFDRILVLIVEVFFGGFAMDKELPHYHKIIHAGICISKSNGP
jgi:hypothetical protein